MTEKTKQFSQLWDDGVRSGVIAQIGEKVFTLLAALAPFMNEDGSCYPSEESLGRILGKSPRAVAGIVARAKKTNYREEPVLTAKQQTKEVNGKLEWSTNLYTISKPIRDDLLGRYSSVGKKLHTERGEEIIGKGDSPYARIPHTENMPTNDSQSVNNIYSNDKGKSALQNRSFRGIATSGFEKKIDSGKQQHCHDIAQWLGEENMNFILHALNDKNCGMGGIDWAFGMTKEDYARGGIRNKGALFNSYIQKYKNRVADS